MELAHRPDDDLEALKDIDPSIGLGIGVVDVKVNHIESADEVARRIERAEARLGEGRVRWVHPDCGFWMLKRSIADGKMAALGAVRRLLLPVLYDNVDLLHSDDFQDFSAWHHEGIGEIAGAPDGGMRLHCSSSAQGREGCMAFFRPNLPDQVAFEYDLTVRSHGGLVINYLAIRGLNGEDLIEDRAKLPPRTGVMSDYYSKTRGLQSYHVSVSRFDDSGRHTGTSNWRRNPGLILCGHGVDPVQEIGRRYAIRVTKDAGHGQVYIDGAFAHAFMDRDTTRYPIPDTGKFGFRVIGSDVTADIARFRVYRIRTAEPIWSEAE
jgi:hypothetical protein